MFHWIYNILPLSCIQYPSSQAKWFSYKMCIKFFFNLFLSCSKPFSTSHVMFFFFMFNDLRQEAIVRFVDIGGIVSHHCLNFVFINLVKFEIYELYFYCFNFNFFLTNKNIFSINLIKPVTEMSYVLFLI